MLRDLFASGFDADHVRAFAALCISMLLALGLHEFAHARVATWCGDPTPEKEGRLTLNPLAHLDPIGTILILFIGFGWGKAVRINPMNFRHLRRDLMLTAVAGPVTNIALATIGIAGAWLLVVLAQVGLSRGIFTPLALLSSVFVYLNLLLAAFNLLPIGGLDGVKVVQWFLPPRAAESFYRNANALGLLPLFVLFLFPAVGDVLFAPVRFVFELVMPWGGIS